MISNSRERLLFVYNYLRQSTDRENVTTPSKIERMFRKNGLYVKRDTIYSDLRALRDSDVGVFYESGKCWYESQELYFSPRELSVLSGAMSGYQLVSIADKMAILRKLNRGQTAEAAAEASHA